MNLYEESKSLKLTTLSLLAASSAVLMSVIRIPYPIAPFLMIEFSNFVVIFAFMLFGVKEAIGVALLKTACDMMINGLQTASGGSMPIVTHVTALIASLSYVLALWICSKFIRKDKVHHKIFKYTLTVLIVSTIMTLANYTILTPLYLGERAFFGIGRVMVLWETLLD